MSLFQTPKQYGPFIEPPWNDAATAALSGTGKKASLESINKALGHYAEHGAPNKKQDEKENDEPEASVSAQLGYDSENKKANVDLEGEYSAPIGKSKFGAGAFGKYNPTESSYRLGPSLKYDLGGKYGQEMEFHGGYSRSDNLGGSSVGGKYSRQLRPGDEGKPYKLETGVDLTRYPGRNDFDASAKVMLGNNQFGFNGTYSSEASRNKIGLEYMYKLSKNVSLGLGASANPGDLSHPTVGAKVEARF